MEVLLLHDVHLLYIFLVFEREERPQLLDIPILLLVFLLALFGCLALLSRLELERGVVGRHVLLRLFKGPRLVFADGGSLWVDRLDRNLVHYLLLLLFLIVPRTILRVIIHGLEGHHGH